MDSEVERCCEIEEEYINHKEGVRMQRIAVPSVVLTKTGAV
jgi:hypothetical protein